MLLLLQITCDDDMSWSCDLTLVGAYGVLTDRGSKVIKGSFPVLSYKTSRIFFLRTEHGRIFKFKLEQCILILYMCIFFQLDQRSLRGSKGQIHF